MRVRFRTLFLAGGSAAVLAALYLTDPDRGVSTGMLLLSIVTPLLAVAFAHLARKALHDYPEADARTLFTQAGRDPIGAGLALVAMALVVSALLGLFGRSAHAQGLVVPERAHLYLGTLKGEVAAHFQGHPQPSYFGGLIEHESCITPRHARCWSPTAQLRTAREEGAGLGQLTRAWAPDGGTRFDALSEMRTRHPALGALDWATIYSRPDLQLRAVVLKSRDEWRALGQVADAGQRLAMADAAYNGGGGRVQRDRRACQVTPGCDPQRWWHHVEGTCTASRVPLYGGRSACDINRHHVRDVLLVRTPRYQGLL